MPVETEGKGAPEEIKLVLRKSRKAFIIEYACGVLLLGFLAVMEFRGTPVNVKFKAFIFVVALLAILVPELSRLFLSYTISTEKISIVKGFIKHTRKNIHYLPLGFIPDINLKQSRIQRILNYGTVFVEGGAPSGEKSFEIKDIDQPQNVLEMIEGFIDHARRNR